jgi:hypothetical protein
MAENNLTITMQQLDATLSVLAKQTFLASDTNPTVGDYRGAGNLVDNTLTTISLPITQPRQIMIRNTHVSAKITVTWTPNGVSSVVVGVIGPGDVIALWNQAAGTSYGISQLKLQSDTASNTTFQLFLGG